MTSLDAADGVVANAVAAPPGSGCVCHQNQRARGDGESRCASRNSSSRSPRTKSRHSADSRLVKQPDREPRRMAGRLISAPAGSRAVGHRGEGMVGLAQRRDTRGPQRVELAAAAAPLRGRLADPGFEKALALEPVERGVDRVDRHVPPGAGVNLLADGGAVRASWRSRRSTPKRTRAVRNRQARADGA